MVRQDECWGSQEIRARAKKIKLVLADNDGVLTDTGVYYSDAGEIMKRFSIRDGMGVERLRAAGIETGIITGELSPSIKARAEKLNITHLYMGVKDKAKKLAEILADTGYKEDEIAYIGDDYNDLEVIDIVNQAGLTAAPQDAMPLIIDTVIYHCQMNGGQGAFRDFAEWIIAHRNSLLSY
jgi:3-deoxy-D-manno-octulosonate 8-phosphate phosphatase (KDO 8-P phosphatase)